MTKRSLRWWAGGFVALFSAQLVSSVGDRISFVVLPFALLALEFSIGEIALVLGARAVGYAVVVLYGGVLSDRMNRKKLLIGSDLVRFAAQSVTLLFVLIALDIPALFCLAQVVFGAAEGVFRPAARSIMPEVVPEKSLERANGYATTAFQTGFLVGPLIAGASIALNMLEVGLAIDALSFLISAACLSRLPSVARTQASARRSIHREMRDGWRVLRTQRWLLIVITASTLFHLTALSAVFVLGPVLADERLGGGAVWGILVTFFGLGGLFGGVVATRIRTIRPVYWILGGLLVVACQPIFLASGLPIAAIATLQFLAGVALSIYSVVQDSAEQRLVPRAALARVSSIDLFSTTAAMPIGFFLSGQLAEVAGTSTSMWVMAAIAVAGCVVAAAVSVAYSKSSASTQDV